MTIGVKPFYFPGGSTGCLLIHGFGGSPIEMMPLGEYLRGKGITVSGVLLEGHGTKPSDLRGRSCEDWIGSAAAGLEKLKSICSHVFLIGFSMGGTIALHLAANYQADGVITVCAPVYLELKLYLTRPIEYLLHFKKAVDHNIKDPCARNNHFAYNTVPPGALIQLFSLMRSVRSELCRITVPALVIQSQDDGVVPCSNGPYIYSSLVNTAGKKFIWLKNSGHMAVIDYDQELVMSEINNFIKSRLGESPGA
ncbi:alpha/beta hydrolase [Pelotomaculum propionicicum]|uniref:alpha/beta hydrolase n=1 Tax=Pelotomaculum propionicicum TaxID=258475 RepID=UPI003B81ADF4